MQIHLLISLIGRLRFFISHTVLAVSVSWVALWPSTSLWPFKTGRIVTKPQGTFLLQKWHLSFF